MAERIETIDLRKNTGVASGALDILLFNLGTTEIFGINVFKVREVTRTPQITKTPNVPDGVEGLISLRGSIIPVLRLDRFLALEEQPVSADETMMVAEFSGRMLGFLVNSVDKIIRVDWNQVRAPDSVLSHNQGLITAITELPDGRLVSVMDVEQIVAIAFGESIVSDVVTVEGGSDMTVFFVDDSSIARKKIIETLEKMGVRHKNATNGKEAWDRLSSIASHAEQTGIPITELVSAVLTDAEMPEMDGYALVKLLKSDPILRQVPVVMHSSLSHSTNRDMGRKVGVDAYVTKFDARELSETLRPLLLRK